VVHKLSAKVVRKVPSDKAYYYSVRACEIEAEIYIHLGKHRRVTRYLTSGDGYIELRYEPNGDLESYLRTHTVTDGFRYRVARQTIEAVDFVHRKGIIHSDLSARQFLVDRHLNVRIADFGGSSLHGSEAIVMENATHFLPRDDESPNTVQSDIFALGSTIYEILVGQKPYEGKSDEEVQQLFSNMLFPPLEIIKDTTWRSVIQRCWQCQYETTHEILRDISATLRTMHTRTLFPFSILCSHSLCD
jgi:serine/threonine protein kinase